MILSDGFIRDAKNIFVAAESSDSHVLREELSLDSNNVFRRSLIIEVNDDEVEIPVIAREHFESLVSEKINYSLTVKTKRIILPLYDNASSQERRTFDSIIISEIT